MHHFFQMQIVINVLLSWSNRVLSYTYSSLNIFNKMKRGSYLESKKNYRKTYSSLTKRFFKFQRARLYISPIKMTPKHRMTFIPGTPFALYLYAMYVCLCYVSLNEN